MLSRRAVLATAALSLAAALPTVRPARAAGETFRLGVLPFGTASWEAAIIKERRLDEANGFTLEPVKLAGNDAARIAFLGGQVDAIVGDLIFAARLGNEGRGVRFSPYSTMEGALMVPADSPIKDLKGLAGKRVGVAGGALDKNWILLQAQARETAGLELASAAQIAYGAPPLLAQKLETGELDASLLYWQFCARLEAKGFKRLISADDVMRAFGARGPVSLIGYLYDGRIVADRGEVVRGFARASAAAKDALANEPQLWESVRPLMAADDEATFTALKRDFLAGIPRRAIAAERADGERVYAALVRFGGEKLLGPGRSLPTDLYLDASGNG
ncbi:ABC transporter substrate-binding protein [Methylorubrum populi]|uniref:ABC transporter substrate-binding protein n=1 Tax=Methylobacterium radiotolerans TaxID=31998 RepID=A0ABU7T4D1_9HYPH|nr:ABC transporter substrate-binding protein [Methylobacterium sp. B4]PXW65680.1 NitT/TauT family transport system substrate-binding protein [Methylobacterium sp. B4]